MLAQMLAQIDKKKKEDEQKQPSLWIKHYLFPSLLVCCVLILVPYIIYFARVSKDHDAFLGPFYNITWIMLFSVLFTATVSVKVNAQAVDPGVLLLTMSVFGVFSPIAEEIVFRYLLPRHFNWFAHIDIVSVVCCVLFGLWHMVNYKAVAVQHAAIKAPRSYAIAVICCQVVSTALLAWQIVQTQDFVIGIVLHVYYNVTALVLHTFFTWFYRTMLVHPDTNFMPCATTVSHSVATKPLLPIPQSGPVVATAAELKALYISEYPQLYRRRRSEPLVTSEERQDAIIATRKDNKKERVRKEKQPAAWTVWRTLETQLQVQERRRDRKQDDELRAMLRLPARADETVEAVIVAAAAASSSSPPSVLISEPSPPVNVITSSEEKKMDAGATVALTDLARKQQ